IELETCARRTTPPGFAHEGALAMIALPDRALDMGRDLARVVARALAGARPHGPGALALLQLLDQGIQRPVEHLGEVSRRERMAKQLLGVAQLVLGAASDRELEHKSLGRHRRQLRAPRANLPRGKLVGT